MVSENECRHRKKVQNCEQCEKMSNIPKSVPPHPCDWPTKPMERIHLDFFGPFYEHQCLILVDAYSGWIEAEEVKIMNSSASINLIDKWVSRYGIPNQIVTDNATQFTSGQFKSHMKQNDINHITSPAFHQSSNGCAERAVQTLKKTLLKNEVSREHFQKKIDEVLMRYRATPNYTEITPSGRFLGRNIRTHLDLIKPKAQKPIKESPKEKIRHFAIGDRVLVKNEYRGRDKWIPGKVSKVLGSRCYLVNINGKGTIKRHIDQTRNTSTMHTDIDLWDNSINTEDLESPSGDNSNTDTRNVDTETDNSPRYPHRTRNPVSRYGIDE